MSARDINAFIKIFLISNHKHLINTEWVALIVNDVTPSLEENLHGLVFFKRYTSNIAYKKPIVENIWLLEMKSALYFTIWFEKYPAINSRSYLRMQQRSIYTFTNKAIIYSKCM